jgi:hypothetical protein
MRYPRYRSYRSEIFFLSGSLRILHVPSHLCVTSCFGAGRSWHSYSRHISVSVRPHFLVTMSTEFFSTISCAHVRFFFSRGILILATSLKVSALISSWCPVSPHLCHLLSSSPPLSRVRATSAWLPLSFSVPVHSFSLSVLI